MMETETDDSEPEDFRDRVCLEKDALNERIDKLLVFMHSNHFPLLPVREQDMMRRQLWAMHRYSAALAERLTHWGLTTASPGDIG